MSIIIHGLDMPAKNTGPLSILIYDDGDIAVVSPIPTQSVTAEQLPPHGRLVDADALIQQVRTEHEDSVRISSANLDTFIRDIRHAPTIIKKKNM